MVLNLQLGPDAWKVAAVTSFYMAAALVMIFVNKATLIANPDLPLLFIFIQLVLAVALLHTSAFFVKKIVIPTLSLQNARSLFPVVFVNVVGLSFNTSVCEMSKHPFFRLQEAWFYPSQYQRVTIGFLLGITPSTELPVNAKPSSLSLFFGFLSAFFIAIHAVLIKSSLGFVDNSAIQLAYWTNLGSAVMLLPVLFLDGEVARMSLLLTNSAEPWNWHPLFLGSLVTGVFGYLLCVAGLLSIKVTSPVTHMFSSSFRVQAVRSCLQTALGVWIFGDILTINRLLCIAVILLGTMYYTWIKARGKPKPPKPAASDLEKAEEVLLKDTNMRENGEVEDDVRQ